MNQVINLKEQALHSVSAFGWGLFGFSLFSCWILIDVCALDGVGKGKAFAFISEEI